LLLLLRLYRRRAAGELEGAGSVSISSSSSWIPRKRRFGSFSKFFWAIREVCKKSRSSSLGTSDSFWRTWCSSNSSL
jgi:hypothetical protein